MTWRQWVLVGIALAVLILLAAEAVALANRETGDTITDIVREAVHRWPALAFALGYLMAHFTWND